MKVTRQKPAKRVPRTLSPDVAAEFEDTLVVERPDGFYLKWKSGSREAGPFATLLEAIESERATDDVPAESGEALAEAEADLGMADWIDPETAAPAEDHVPRIEDH